MLLIQLTGFSVAAKITIAENIRLLAEPQGLRPEIIDGDIYRKAISKDLGFSKEAQP